MLNVEIKYNDKFDEMLFHSLDIQKNEWRLHLYFSLNFCNEVLAKKANVALKETWHDDLLRCKKRQMFFLGNWENII